MNKILVGFEVPTAKHVFMGFDHTNVSGLTQKTGKTTTIEALVDRSGMRAVVFITKRGEQGFYDVNEIRPFYKEQTGWRYVKAILEASESRKMNFEEAWIIKACSGAKNLRDVMENTEKLRRDARRDMDKDQFLKIIEYLKVIVPEVERVDWASSLNLEKGVNVMDLLPFPYEMQCLIIQSTLDYIMERMKGVIAVVPEAWKFLPKSNTPVKLAAERFIRQGAAINNYLWIDSQDLAGVDTTYLKSCYNWLMGFQRELNEAQRVAKTAGKSVNIELIQKLKLGHFLTIVGTQKPRVVYALPRGVPEELAKKVARGEIEPEVVKDYLEKLKKNHKEDDDEVYKEQYEKEKARADKLEKDLEDANSTLEQLNKGNMSLLKNEGEYQALKEKCDGLETRYMGAVHDSEEKDKRIKELEAQQQKLETDAKQVMDAAMQLDEFREALKGFVKILFPGIEEPMNIANRGPPPSSPIIEQNIDVELTKTEINLEVKKVYQQVQVDGNTTEGQILMLWVKGDIPSGTSFMVKLVRDLFEKYGYTDSNVQIGGAFKKLLEWGFVEIVKAGHRTDYKFPKNPSELTEAGRLSVTEKVVVG